MTLDNNNNNFQENPLHKAFRSILEMPYYKNDHAHSGASICAHEDAVAVRFVDAGFTRSKKSLYPKLSTKILKSWTTTGDATDLIRVTDGMPDGTLIVQPAGSQGHPDILVKDFKSRFVAVECKSSKGCSPMWNDNPPKPLCVYIFCSEHVNQTTMFMGRDVISQETYDVYWKARVEFSEYIKKYRDLFFQADIFGRGWDKRIRWQHYQSGGNEKNNYFTHPDRARCELNVLAYANE